MNISKYKKQIKNLQNLVSPKENITYTVYMDENGNVLWNENCNYSKGVLVIPLPLNKEAWSAKFTKELNPE